MVVSFFPVDFDRSPGGDGSRIQIVTYVDRAENPTNRMRILNVFNRHENFADETAKKIKQVETSNENILPNVTRHTNVLPVDAIVADWTHVMVIVGGDGGDGIEAYGTKTSNMENGHGDYGRLANETHGETLSSSLATNNINQEQILH